MATVDRIQRFDLTSPEPILYAINGERIASENSNEVSVKRGNAKALLTKTAPTLVSKGSGDGDYLSALVQYMTEILLSSVKMTGFEADLNKVQNSASNDLVKLSEDQVNKATEDLQKLEKALEEARHASFWQKLAFGIAGGLLALVGALSGNPALVIMGGFMLAMTFSGASEKLQNAIGNLSPGYQALILGAIAVGSAAVICVAASAVGSVATETVVAETGTAATAESTTSSSSFVGGLVSTSAQMTMVFNPFVPLIEAALEKLGTGKDKAKMVAEITGMIIAMIFSFKAASLTSEGAVEGLSPKLSAKFGEEAIDKARSMANILRSGFMAVSGVFSVLQGKAMLDQSNVEKDMGETQGALTIYQALLAMMGSTISQSQEAYKGVLENYAAINNRWDQFVEPYAYAAEIMG